MFSFAKAAVVAASAVTVIGFGAATANAAVVNGPSNNVIAEAGFQVSGNTPVNEVRTNVTVAPNSDSDGAVFLESNVNGGREFALAVRNEGGEYFLADASASVANPATGAPAVSGLTWHNVSTINSSTGALFPASTGGAYTIELHYSTSRHTVVAVAGPTETNTASLDTFSNVHGNFFAPAVEGLNGSPSGGRTDLFFNRNGLTEPAGSNKGGIAGTRITLDFFNLDQTQGVNAVARANYVASSLPATSSAFNVRNALSLTGTFNGQQGALTAISNRPDSGGNGNWGIDTINRDVIVTNHGVVPNADCSPAAIHCWSYTATLADSGTFNTIHNAFTPNQFGTNAGKHIASSVFGTISGSGSYTFDASTLANGSLVPGTTSGSALTTGDWYKLFFSPGTEFSGPGLNNNWSWSYTDSSSISQKWTDAASNNGGQSLFAGNITG